MFQGPLRKCFQRMLQGQGSRLPSKKNHHRPSRSKSSPPELLRLGSSQSPGNGQGVSLDPLQLLPSCKITSHLANRQRRQTCAESFTILPACLVRLKKAVPRLETNSKGQQDIKSHKSTDRPRTNFHFSCSICATATCSAGENRGIECDSLHQPETIEQNSFACSTTTPHNTNDKPPTVEWIWPEVARSSVCVCVRAHLPRGKISTRNPIVADFT